MRPRAIRSAWPPVVSGSRVRNEARADLDDDPGESGTRVLDRAVLAGLVIIFLPALANLARVWEEVDYQSHGFLVPVVAGWIAWSTRGSRRLLPRSIDARGAAVLALALALYSMSLLAASPSGQGLALVMATAGVVWWRQGRRRLRAMAFPIGFLVFMVPIPADWFTPLAVRLLLMVSWAAAGVLHVLGLEVTRQGNVLMLGGGTPLLVAEACSGLTAILTLLPIAVLVAYLSPLRSVRRAVLVASALPIAMAANLLRVVVTVLAAQVWDAVTVTSDPWHSLVGLLLYAIACVGLLAVARILRPREVRRPQGSRSAREPGSPPHPN